MSNNKTLVVVVGPTASGKTSLAIQLANDLNTEIISTDSRQFYKELQIGTAAPTEEELNAAKHHLIGNLSIHDYYNVSMYENDALNASSEIFKDHEHVVAVGGSGLYINALCDGIDEIPDPKPEVRKQLAEDLETKGLDYIQSLLKEKDPDFYKIVDINNPKRVLRALEVCLTTGESFTKYRVKNLTERPFNIIKIGLLWNRELLVDRIHQRVDIMIQQGLIEEAKAMHQYKHLNSLNTVGYKELFDYFEDKCTLEFAIEKIKTNTRRYAKRQMTWFRKDQNIVWFAPDQYEEMLKFVRQY
ncbi:MAG: tRNA (adenosine(37)-N6)-dimethylallyltransferase MiaA [Hyphomicrobiales bacterium]